MRELQHELEMRVSGEGERNFARMHACACVCMCVCVCVEVDISYEFFNEC